MPASGNMPFYPPYHVPHPLSSQPPPHTHHHPQHPHPYANPMRVGTAGSGRGAPLPPLALYSGSAADVADESSKKPSGKKAMNICTCRKSRCLKLYCQCFSGSRTCGASCRCSDCHNTSAHAEEIAKARRSIAGRNSKAFSTAEDHIKCKCKRSYCLKKYCECFQKGVVCGDACLCDNCLNNGSHPLSQAMTTDNKNKNANTPKHGNVNNTSTARTPVSRRWRHRVGDRTPGTNSAAANFAAQQYQQQQRQPVTSTTTTTTTSNKHQAVHPMAPSSTSLPSTMRMDQTPVSSAGDEQQQGSSCRTITPERVMSPSATASSKQPPTCGLDMIAALAMTELSGGNISTLRKRDVNEKISSSSSSFGGTKDPSSESNNKTSDDTPPMGMNGTTASSPKMAAAPLRHGGPPPPPLGMGQQPLPPMQYPPPAYNFYSPYGMPPPPPPHHYVNHHHQHMYRSPPPPPAPMRPAVSSHAKICDNGATSTAPPHAKTTATPVVSHTSPPRKRSYEEEKKEEEIALRPSGDVVVGGKKAKLQHATAQDDAAPSDATVRASPASTIPPTASSSSSPVQGGGCKVESQVVESQPSNQLQPPSYPQPPTGSPPSAHRPPQQPGPPMNQHNHYYPPAPPPPHYGYPSGYGCIPPGRSYPPQPCGSPPSAFPRRQSPPTVNGYASTPPHHPMNSPPPAPHYPNPPAPSSATGAAIGGPPPPPPPPPTTTTQMSPPSTLRQSPTGVPTFPAGPPPKAAGVPDNNMTPPVQPQTPVLYTDIMSQPESGIAQGLPKFLSFRKICSNCGRDRTDHEDGFGKRCSFLTCGRCGAGRETHKLAKKSMGVLCKLTFHEGADATKTKVYDDKLQELYGVLHEEAQSVRREAARRKRTIPVCEKCGAGRETHKMAGKSMGRNCGLTIGEGASPKCLQAYYKGRRMLAARNKAAKAKEASLQEEECPSEVEMKNEECSSEVQTNNELEGDEESIAMHE